MHYAQLTDKAVAVIEKWLSALESNKYKVDEEWVRHDWMVKTRDNKCDYCPLGVAVAELQHESNIPDSDVWIKDRDMNNAVSYVPKTHIMHHPEILLLRAIRVPVEYIDNPGIVRLMGWRSVIQMFDDECLNFDVIADLVRQVMRDGKLLPIPQIESYKLENLENNLFTIKETAQ